ncbi:hypothetical protein D3C80_2148050 [compost metagenome]
MSPSDAVFYLERLVLFYALRGPNCIKGPALIVIERVKQIEAGALIPADVSSGRNTFAS